MKEPKKKLDKSAIISKPMYKFSKWITSFNPIILCIIAAMLSLILGLMSNKCSEVIKNLINVINKLIVSIYDGKIGFGPLTKKILTINQKQIIQCKYDKDFLNKTLKDILSYEITGRISNYNPDHNKNIIELLLNEEDETKRKKFEEFFNLRFIDCISHYSGKIHEPILIGIEKLEETCDEMKMKGEDDDYINIFSHFVENFEEKIKAKKKRNPKNKKTD
jgi:hypothetical protein